MEKFESEGPILAQIKLAKIETRNKHLLEVIFTKYRRFFPLCTVCFGSRWPPDANIPDSRIRYSLVGSESLLENKIILSPVLKQF